MLSKKEILENRDTASKVLSQKNNVAATSLEKKNFIDLLKAEVKAYFPEEVFIEPNIQEIRDKVREHFKKFVQKTNYKGEVYIFCDNGNNSQYYIDLNFFILSFRIDSTVLEFKIRNINNIKTPEDDPNISEFRITVETDLE